MTTETAGLVEGQAKLAGRIFDAIHSVSDVQRAEKATRFLMRRAAAAIALFPRLSAQQRLALSVNMFVAQRGMNEAVAFAHWVATGEVQ